MNYKTVIDIINDNCKLIDNKIYKYNKTKNKLTIVKNKKNHSGGYCKICINGKMVYYHRALWILSKGEDIPDSMQIDHIDGNKINNVIENLRLVTNRENGQNWNIHRDGRLVGAKYHEPTKKWKSQIRIPNGEQIHIGTFDNEEDAHRAYLKALSHFL